MQTANNAPRHPPGFWFLFFGELAERSSFYGMKVLLMLYLVRVMGIAPDVAGPINHVFTASCYLLPLGGGYIADRWLGKYRTVIYFALPYICGHLILGSTSSRVMLFVALGLLALGSGAIKPNVSPLMAQLYDDTTEDGRKLRSQAFSWFYAGINIGAFISMFAVPLVRDKWGYHAAFLCPTILMTVSLAIFALGKKHYPVETPGKRPVTSDIQRAADHNAIKRLTGLFGLLVFFWAIFDQASSTWTLFAESHTILYGLAPDMIQGLNPVLVVVLTPVFSAFWNWRNEGRTQPFAYTQKMLVGFLLVVVCMLVMGGAGWYATHYGKVSIAFEMLAYVIITLSELSISVVGLEMACTEAPPHLRSTVTAIFLFTVFLGNLLAGVLSSIYPHMNPGTYFFMLAGMMAIVTLLFRIVSRRFEVNSRQQSTVVA